MERLQIVPYEESMLQALRDIYAHWVRTSTATFHLEDPSLEDMSALVTPASPRHYSCVLREGDEGGPILGYGCIVRYKSRPAYDDTAELSIYLAPGSTGRGLGKRLLAHLEAKAREAGFHCLMAGITAENAPSIRLFESSGYLKCAHFREVGRKFGRLLDVTAWQKILD